MVMCPVCEHMQASGDECDNCGKRLSAPQPLDVAMATLPELEGTGLPGGRAPVQVPPLVELEATRVSNESPELPLELVPELQLTRAPEAKVGAVSLMAELESGRAASDGAWTPEPMGPVVCRYCKNEQLEGLVCERCGMRLPRLRREVSSAPRQAVDAEAGWVPCPRCHTASRPGRACVTCGAMVRAE